MGQTDGDSFFADDNGMVWTWVYICPHCDAELASKGLIDNMGFDGDDIIGCAECGRDVSVDAAQLILIDELGNRG